ncbi:hypothetical protein B566_EDAN012419 [Ephemera danica]|nr:hypothetical protein B566_EDAN012419 [Ephemera danica]
MEKVTQESENQYEEMQESSEIDPRLLVSVKLETNDETFASHGQAGPSKVVDISQLCRACAKPYAVGTGTKLNPPPDDIAAHLEQLFGIQLREGDGLPTTLCDTCKNDMEHWIVVCRAVEEAQQFLKMNPAEGEESGMDEGMDPHAAEMLTVECDTDMYGDSEQVFGIPDFGEFSQQYDMANKKKWSSERRRNFLLRAQGKEYQGFRKIGDKIVVVTRKARKVGPRCGFFCQRSNVRYCNEMSDSEREEIHRQFWNSTWAEKRVFVKNHVEEYETSRKSPSAVKHREKALRYCLHKAKEADVHTLSWPVFFEIFHNKGLSASDLLPAEQDYKDVIVKPTVTLVAND